MRSLLFLVVTLATLLPACGHPANPPQSPATGPQRPETTTSDGSVVGADGVPPSQKLEEGPKLDSRDGLEPASPPPRE
jgi:hypothetical protein